MPFYCQANQSKRHQQILNIVSLVLLYTTYNTKSFILPYLQQVNFKINTKSSFDIIKTSVKGRINHFHITEAPYITAIRAKAIYHSATKTENRASFSHAARAARGRLFPGILISDSETPGAGILRIPEALFWAAVASLARVLPPRYK